MIVLVVTTTIGVRNQPSSSQFQDLVGKNFQHFPVVLQLTFESRLTASDRRCIVLFMKVNFNFQSYSLLFFIIIIIIIISIIIIIIIII